MTQVFFSALKKMFVTGSVGLILFAAYGFLSSVYAPPHHVDRPEMRRDVKKINIVLVGDFMIEDGSLLHFELGNIQTSRPGSWRVRRVRTSLDIQHALQLSDGEVLQTMIVRGIHAEREKDEVILATRSWDPEEGVVQFTPVNFESAFREMQAHHGRNGREALASDFLIAFDACHFSPLERPEEFFRQLAFDWGMRRGSIYANYTEGYSPPSQIFGTAAWETSQGWLAQSLRLLEQFVWPVSLPVRIALYRLKNQGYLALIEEGRVVQISLYGFSKILNEKNPEQLKYRVGWTKPASELKVDSLERKKSSAPANNVIGSS